MRILFPEHGRYTRKNVRGFYNAKENWVHLIYPDSVENPFLGGGLLADSVDKFYKETGIAVSWTPVGSKHHLVDDSNELVGVEEVLV